MTIMLNTITNPCDQQENFTPWLADAVADGGAEASHRAVAALRQSLSREGRLQVAVIALAALDPEDAEALIGTEAGDPDVAFGNHVEQARWWASVASVSECRAYMLAAWERVPETVRERFIAWATADERRAA